MVPANSSVLLRHDAEALAQLVGGQVAHVTAVDGDLAFAGG
jgi:hypothetical protein